MHRVLFPSSSGLCIRQFRGHAVVESRVDNSPVAATAVDCVSALVFLCAVCKRGCARARSGTDAYGLLRALRDTMRCDARRVTALLVSGSCHLAQATQWGPSQPHDGSHSHRSLHTR